MKNETTQGPQDTKRVYHTPEFIQVALRPEEAVLGACKTSAASGPGNKTCTILGNCSIPGS
jgi:hypothetical protein